MASGPDNRAGRSGRTALHGGACSRRTPPERRRSSTLDALSKLFDNRKAGGRPHILCNSLGRMLCSLFVPFTPRESIADKFPFEGSLNQAGPRSSCKGHSRRCTCRWKIGKGERRKMREASRPDVHACAGKLSRQGEGKLAYLFTRACPEKVARLFRSGHAPTL